MSQDITAESVRKDQEEAKWAYENAKEKFYYSMLEVVFLRIKSHLSHQGLRKVMDVDERRDNNENFGVEFSQKTWIALAEAWNDAEGLAMSRIAKLYGLEIADLDMSKVSSAQLEQFDGDCS